MERIQMFMKKYKITSRKLLMFLLIIALLMLMIPFSVRQLNHQPLIIGKEAYYHLGIAKTIFSGENLRVFPAKTTPLFNINYNIFHIFLSLPLLFLRERVVAIVLPILLGLLAVFLFHMLLKQFSVKKEYGVPTLLVFIFSNIFIYFFLTVNQESFAFVLTLLGLLLFYRNKTTPKVISLFIFLIVSSLSSFNSLIIILSLVFLSMFRKPNKRFLIIALVLAAFVALIMRLPFFFHYDYTASPIFMQIISDFSGLKGFSLFSLMLAVIGFFTSWKSRKKIYPLYLLFIVLLPFLFYLGPSISIYLVIIISLAGAKAVYDLINFKWAIQVIKGLTFLLLVCGFLFSAISTVNQVSDLPPSSAEVRSLELFGAIKSKPGIVFSDISNSFWIQGIAKSRVFLNPLLQKEPSFRDDFRISQEILHSTNLKQLKPLLDEYHIDYFWINEEMKEEVWKGQRKELLFLFENNETFKNIYDREGIEIWDYIGRHYEVE